MSLFSTVATKVLIALTGLSLVGFLCVHLAGNLLLYFGPATFNAYSHALISNPFVIPLEIGLLAIFVIARAGGRDDVVVGPRARGRSPTR